MSENDSNIKDTPYGPYLNQEIVYLRDVLVSKYWIILACMAASSALVGLYLLIARPYYTSETTVQVESQQVSQYQSDTKSDDDPTGLKGEDALKTIEQALQLQSLYEAVAIDSEVASNPVFIDGVKPQFRFQDKEMGVPQIAQKLIKLTKVELIKGTRLISIKVDFPNPEMSQILANKIVEIFLQRIDYYVSGNKETASRFLEQESKKFKNNLQNAQNDLQNYTQALAFEDSVHEKYEVVQTLKERYRQFHPKLITATALLANARIAFHDEIQRVRASSPKEELYWSKAIGDPNKLSFDEFVDQELRLVDARKNVLSGEVDTQTALYNGILKQMQEADVSKKMSPIIAHLVSPADLPLRPSKPAPMVFVPAGLAGGFLMGIFIIYYLYIFESSFHTPEEIETFLKVPILSAIPLVPDVEKAWKVKLTGGVQEAIRQPYFPVFADPGTPCAEAFRTLRTSLELMGNIRKDKKITMFSSALPSEGKTFCSCNFAMSLAQTGLRTLLLDADLRQPRVHKYFNLSARQKGLYDVVALDLPLGDVITPDIIPNLDVLTAGSECRYPAEVLSSIGLRKTLEAARGTYDRIVVDTPPITLVSDLLILAPYIDTLCLILICGKSPKKALFHAMKLLDRSKVKADGLILNQYVTLHHHSYYYGVNEYGYGYRQAYAHSK